MSRYILHICTFIPFILILLSSCGTSRKATSGNSGKPANIPQAVVLDDGLDDITARLLNEASTWLGYAINTVGPHGLALTAPEW